jgi:hypothetical protein
MNQRRLQRISAALFVFGLLSAGARAEGGEMTMPADPMTLCRKKFSTPAQIVANSLRPVKDVRSLMRLSGELQAVLVCDGVVGREPKLCKQTSDDAANATGGPEIKTLAGDLIYRCDNALRFSSFLREAYAAKEGQQDFPACEAYFSRVQAVKVGPGFGAACADVEAALRNKTDNLCTPKLLPFVIDTKQWPAMCGAIGRVWLQDDPAACSVFPDPHRCAVEAEFSRAFSASGPSLCPGSGVEAGVCWAAMSKTRATACRGLWQRLQGDFCSEMIRVGMNGKKGAADGDSSGE